jgi:hypothetical protein
MMEAHMAGNIHPTTSIRLPADVRDALERAAASQQRNISNMALHIISQYLMACGELPVPGSSHQEGAELIQQTRDVA